jgi:hypothetical protein
MKSLLFVVLALLAVPALGQQPPPWIHDCAGCVLGLYDQPEMLTNYGTVTPLVPKDLYIGFKPGPEFPGLTGIEFSVSGLRQAEDGILVTAVEGITSPPPTIILGSLPAPADTAATSVQTGGMNIAWAYCITGPRGLGKFTILTFSPLSNKVFRVMHRFPTTNPWYGLTKPVAIGCDAPTYSAWRVLGGCYIANWDGTTPVNCQLTDIPVAATPATWGSVKGMYR